MKDKYSEYIASLGYAPWSAVATVTQKFTALNDRGYLVYMEARQIEKGFKPKVVSKTNPHSIHNIKLWTNKNRPEFDVISTEYERADKPLKFICKECGYKLSTSWRRFHGGWECPVCKKAKAPVASTGKYDEEVMQCGYTPLELIKTTHKHYYVEDKEGYKYLLSVTLLRSGGSPKKFFIKNKYSIDNIKLKLSSTTPNVEILSKVFKGSTSTLDLRCKVCGHEWSPLASGTISGKGCPKCAAKERSDANRLTLAEVRRKLKNITQTLEILSESYSNNITPLSVECKVCLHKWEASWGSLSTGAGCPACANSTQGWGKSDWKKAADYSQNFDSFKLYVIKCYNDEEEFYKIGRTFTTVTKRFYSFPYNYDVIKVIEGDADEIFDLENVLQREHRRENLSYIPKISFGGETECFSELMLTN